MDFHPLITRVTSLQVRNLVPGRYHKGIARYAIDREGRRWVFKDENDVACDEILAESLSLLIGRRIGAPIPDGALFVSGTRRGWLSSLVEPVFHWDDGQRDYIQNYDGVASMLVLDAITGNGDRHGANVLLEPGEDAPDVRLWAIDQGNALIGHPADFVELGQDLVPANVHIRGLPIGHLEPMVMAAAEVARSVPSTEVRRWAKECGEIVEEPRWEALAEALHGRMRAAPDLALRYLDTLRGHP